MIVSDVQSLLECIRDATRPNFPLACADLFQYLDARVPDNSVIVQLNAERQGKWGKFLGERPRSWQMPTAKEDRESLAYDLFRAVAERGEDGRGLLFHMYRGNFVQNADDFRSDFLQHLVDAINRVGNAEPKEVAGASGREKQQKFGILDAPNLLKSDLADPAGLFGYAVVYFDLDNFKGINTRFSERVVDAEVLPVVQRLVAAAVMNQGYAYAEGGDEMIVLLPNANLEMGAAFAEALREALEAKSIDVAGQALKVTASFGVAAGRSQERLADDANLAKNFAKKAGKNCVAIHVADVAKLWREKAEAQ